MAEPKAKEPWKVTSVKCSEGVVRPGGTSEHTTNFTAGKELDIVFDPTIRCVILTHLRPGATPEAPRVPNPDRPPVIVPLENVIWMR